jgi:hypothetical protein
MQMFVMHRSMIAFVVILLMGAPAVPAQERGPLRQDRVTVRDIALASADTPFSGGSWPLASIIRRRRILSCIP